MSHLAIARTAVEARLQDIFTRAIYAIFFQSVLLITIHSNLSTVEGGTAVIKLRTKSKSTLGHEVRGIAGVL